MRIDLHTHSAVSDGTDTPAGLVVAAVAAGLDVVALTDHDTVDGWDEAAAAVVGTGITLVRGMELSCTAGGVSLHLLAYLFDRADPALAAEMERCRDDRLWRAQEMVRRLGAGGVDLTWPDVEGQSDAASTLGRPHIADALVANGVVADRDEAFARLLHQSSPYYVPHYAADPVAAVGLVRAAGGVTVFAHPAARARGRVVGDDVVVALAQAGLAGLEVDHRDNDAASRQHLRGLAAELGLLVTGSSDYHGTGKANALGENATADAVYEKIVAQATGAAPVAG